MTADATARWQRLEPDERRQQILASAVRLFGEQPYSAMSTTEIAREAGVARALVHHYFGTKRELYLEVVRAMVMSPPADKMLPPQGSLRKRVDWFLDWFLDVMSQHGKTWLIAVGAQGMGNDADVETILVEADNLAADRIIELVEPDLTTNIDAEQLRALIRAYGGMVKAAVREWLDRRTLTRNDVHVLLRHALLGVIRETYPQLAGD